MRFPKTQAIREFFGELPLAGSSVFVDPIRPVAALLAVFFILWKEYRTAVL
jgi:hypothetical protein